ncbi:hypothetical protein HanIR_Chr04g0174591 [Helianthus annuus]|nr:hypothetical protein HanIR_Chr04g0174591 [Helianthus annuus]
MVKGKSTIIRFQFDLQKLNNLHFERKKKKKKKTHDVSSSKQMEYSRIRFMHLNWK